jgi:four helix bundle protein
MFITKMSDSDGEAAETQVWIEFAANCSYISEAQKMDWLRGYDEVGRMLGGMIAHPEKFAQ